MLLSMSESVHKNLAWLCFLSRAGSMAGPLLKVHEGTGVHWSRFRGFDGYRTDRSVYDYLYGVLPA
jgi:hypothetical protein